MISFWTSNLFFPFSVHCLVVFYFPWSICTQWEKSNMCPVVSHDNSCSHGWLCWMGDWLVNSKVQTHSPWIYQRGLGRTKPVAPQCPAALSVYCVYQTNPSMFLVCSTLKKDENSAVWKEKHWAVLFQSYANRSGQRTYCVPEPRGREFSKHWGIWDKINKYTGWRETELCLMVPSKARLGSQELWKTP